jgi:hypothetical protein
MADRFDIGDIIRLSAEFKDTAGAYVDPGQIVARVRDPLGAITVYTYGVDAALIRDATGKYRLDIEATKEGVWFWRFEGKLSNKGAGESSFTVADSKFYKTSGGLVS